jgi:hypothetical protein
MRLIRPSFVVPPPVGARIRTRLRLTSADEQVVATIGRYLGTLAGQDLAWRCELGARSDQRTERKRVMTAMASSRWAGAITRMSNDQWQRGYRNLVDDAIGLRRALRVIDRRLQVPVGSRRGRTRGYSSQSERHEKQRRRQHLQVRLNAVERRLASGRISVCRGGRRLAKLRHHLDDVELSAEAWRASWQAERLFLTADGEAAKPLGNETIRVHPEQGWLELKLPAPLAHLANAPHGRYRLTCPVRFRHRADEWAEQVASGAVRYDIDFLPNRGRWYCSASWTRPVSAAMTVQQAVADGVLAVDLNAGHLACWHINPDGNPVRVGVDLPLALDGLPASTRDGRLRAAVSALLNLACRQGCTAIAIENLDFAYARQAGRETLGRGRRGKRFRQVVAGIPTRQFRERLVQMAANRGIAVVAIDPGWTSIWGQTYWQRPLQAKYPNRKITRHHAACVVLGRRALGLTARRRPGVPTPHRRMEGTPSGVGVESYRPGRAGSQVRAGHDPPATRPGSSTTLRRTGSGDGPEPVSRWHKTVWCHPSVRTTADVLRNGRARRSPRRSLLGAILAPRRWQDLCLIAVKAPGWWASSQPRRSLLLWRSDERVLAGPFCRLFVHPLDVRLQLKAVNPPHAAPTQLDGG